LGRKQVGRLVFFNCAIFLLTKLFFSKQPLIAFLIYSLKDRHKKRFSTSTGQVLEKCSQYLRAFSSGYEEAVQKEGFGVPDKVIPMEPFITQKAHKFLKDVLLQEKMNFNEEDRGILNCSPHC